MPELPVMTVSECLRALNNVLNTQVVQVEGEVQAFSISQQRWCFFSLKDTDGSVVECFMMAFRLKHSLPNGTVVRVIACPNIHAKSGRFRLTVEKVEIVGEGGLRKAMELLKAKLKNEGLFAIARKRTLPVYPNRIGLLTSVQSAAYSDFIKILKDRYCLAEVVVVNAQMQGNSAVLSIRQALRTLVEEKDIDVIVITRGGGSLEDLMAFNDESLARDIFRCSVPVIVAVGHERDITIAEEVADVRASTPSNAAELIVLHRREIWAQLNKIREQALSSIGRRLTMGEHDYERLAAQFYHQLATQHIKSVEKQRIFWTAAKQFEAQISKSRLAIAERANELLIKYKQRVSQTQASILGIQRLLRSMHPRRVLKRGYSIVRINGKVIKSVSKAKRGDNINVTVSDGTLDAEIKTITTSTI